MLDVNFMLSESGSRFSFSFVILSNSQTA